MNQELCFVDESVLDIRPHDTTDKVIVPRKVTTITKLSPKQLALAISKIQMDEIDPEWYKRTIEQGFTKEKPFEDCRYEELKLTLLSIKGWGVCIHCEDDIKQLLSDRSHLYLSARVKMAKGYPNQCHVNSANLHEKYGYKIVTGYGLSRDGMWRQHSWCTDGKDLFETTVKRVLYYGFELNKKESANFVYENYI